MIIDHHHSPNPRQSIGLAGHRSVAGDIVTIGFVDAHGTIVGWSPPGDEGRCHGSGEGSDQRYGQDGGNVILRLQCRSGAEFGLPYQSVAYHAGKIDHDPGCRPDDGRSDPKPTHPAAGHQNR